MTGGEGIPDLVRRRAAGCLDRFCRESRWQEGGEGNRLTWEWEDAGAVLLRPDRPIARLTYQEELLQWTLEQRREDGWRLCLNIQPTLDLERLLMFLEADPFRQFWD